MSEEPMPKLRLIDNPGWLDCDDQHFEASSDRLAPLELRRRLSATNLDDLDYWSKAVAGGWHTDAETQEHIMALARAVPRLTAELRRLRGEP